jgi:hypothetical protein
MAQRAVAAATYISLRSARRVEHETPITTSDIAALIAARQIGRPSISAPWAMAVESWLREDPTLPGVEILRRLGEEHQYTGGKSAVYELVRGLRPPAVAPLVRFEGVPGEFSSSAGTISGKSTSALRGLVGPPVSDRRARARSRPGARAGVRRGSR